MFQKMRFLGYIPSLLSTEQPLFGMLIRVGSGGHHPAVLYCLYDPHHSCCGGGRGCFGAKKKRKEKKRKVQIHWFKFHKGAKDESSKYTFRFVAKYFFKVHSPPLSFQ